MGDDPTRTDPPIDGPALDPEAAVPAAPAETTTGPEASPPAAAQPTERRALKLVVTCRPEGDAHRVLLAIGANGCDPVFQQAAADGLLPALDEVPALLAVAEERWRTQPRYPAATKPRAAAPRQRGPAAEGPTPAAPSAAGATPPAEPTPTAKAAPVGQMALFG